MNFCRSKIADDPVNNISAEKRIPKLYFQAKEYSIILVTNLKIHGVTNDSLPVS